MNLKSYFCTSIIAFNLINLSLNAMDTTFGSPTTFISGPRFATKNLTSFDSAISYYKADSSYNCKGQKTALFSYGGGEDLLKRFVDQSLPKTDTSSVGKALIGGKFTFENYSLAYTQNLGENFYFSLESSLSNVDVRNLTINPISTNGHCLSASEINANPTLKNYLTKLDKLIYSDDKIAFFYNVIGPSFLTAGYTKHFQDFSYIDFIDATLFTGIAIPIINISNKSTTIFSVPIYNYVCLGVPLQASVMVALYDWLNIGGNALVIPFIQSESIVALNRTKTNNVIFLTESGQASINHQPFVYFDSYIQAEQLIPHLSFTAAASYMKQNKTIYEALDQVKFPKDIINAFPAHRPWQAAYVTLCAEIDLATESYKNLPHFQIVYVLPIWGKSVFKTWAISAQMSIDIIW